MRNTLRNIASRLSSKRKSSSILQRACRSVRPSSFGLENLEGRQMLALADLVYFPFDDIDSGMVIQQPQTPGQSVEWVGYYSYEGGSGTANSVLGRSGVGNDRAVLFNKDASNKDYLLMMNGVSAVPLSEFLSSNATVAFWIKTPQNFVGNSGNAYDGPVVLGSDESGGTNDIFWGAILNTGNIAFRVGDAGQITSTKPINDGKWHHVVMSRTIDGSRNDTTPAPAAGTIWLYVDGSLNATANYTDISPKTASYAGLGMMTKTNGNPAVYLNGVAIDDLYIGNEAISERESKLLYDPTEKAPAAASNLRIADATKDVGSRGVRLTWNDNSAYESGFRIERSADNGTTWTAVGTAAAGSTYYVDKGLTPGTTYRYRVVSYGAWGEQPVASHPTLTQATTTAQVTYGQGSGVLATYYDDGGQPDAATGLVNKDLGWKGTMFQRVEPQIAFNWGGGAPDARMGVDTFTSKYEGFIEIPKADYYTFETLTDDGGFLYFDINRDGDVDDAGELIVDDPTYHGAAAGNEKSSDALNPGGIFLQPGKYAFKMLAFENGGDAAATLRWSSLNIAPDTIPLTQFSQPVAETAIPAAPSGLTVTANAPTFYSSSVTLNWTDNSNNERGFVVLRSKDGGNFQEWAFVNGTTFTDTTLVFNGHTYAYQVKAFNLKGSSTAISSSTVQTQPAATAERGLTLDYWNIRGTTAANGVPTSPVEYARVDNVDRTEGTAIGLINYPAVDGANSSKLGIPAETDGNNFTIRWTGTFTPDVTGNYTFWTRTDDDVRFWINGNRVIAMPDGNNFAVGRGVPGLPGDSSGAQALTAGVAYNIRMDYTQGTGGAAAELRVQGPAGSALATQQLLPTQSGGKTFLNTLPAAPVAVTNLTATAGSGAVKLSWTDPSMKTDGYYIEQSSDNGETWSFVANVVRDTWSNTATTTHVVGGLLPSTQYLFRVMDYNRVNESPATVTSAVTTAALSTTPVGNWEFNGNGNDAVTGGTNATLGNGAIFTTRGHGDSSVRIPQGTVSLTDSAQFNPATQITLMAWINAYDLDGNRRIIQKGDSDNQYRLLFEDMTVNGVTEKYLRFHIAGKPVAQVKASTIPNVTGVWHHVAGTYDGQAIKLFVDGVKVAEVAAMGTLPVASNHALYIGSRGGGAVTDRWNGKIDGVRIYDTAVDATTIADLATETAPVAPSDLQVLVPGGGEGMFRLDIKWKDNSTVNFPSFKIYRSTNGTTWEALPVAVDATSYQDTSVAPDTTYWYKVAAYNRLGEASSTVVGPAKTDKAPAGSLSGTNSSFSGETNLTTTGTADWMHFGLNGAGNINSADRIIPDGTVIAQVPFSNYVAWEAEQAVTVTDPDLDGKAPRIITSSTTPVANGTGTSGAASGGRALLMEETYLPHKGQGFAVYNVKITEPGMYRLSVRRRVTNAGVVGGNGGGQNDDILIPLSLNAPTDPSGQFHANWTIGGNMTDYGWATYGSRDYQVSAPGVYTLAIGVSEGGAILDRIVLSKNTSMNDAQRDALVNSPIMGEIAYTQIGTTAPVQATTGGATFSWTDGAPTVSQTPTNQGIQVSGLGNGFRISAPARSAIDRKLRVYVGVTGTGAQGKLVARLSDKSAAEYTATLNSGGTGMTLQMYEITFKSGVDNQSAIVEWTNANANGSVAIFGAAWVDVTPAAPTNLTVKPMDAGVVALQWTDNSVNEQTFKIQRSNDGANWIDVGTALAGSTTWTDTQGGSMYKYRVAAVNAAGTSAYSNVVDGIVLTPLAANSAWKSQDIGAPALAGSALFNEQTATARLTAGGSDIYGTADQFHFMYQQVSGDFVMTAQVLPFDRWNDAGADVDGWIKAGIQVRQSLDAGSKMINHFISAENQTQTNWRQTDGAGAVTNPGSTNTNRRGWLRLERKGAQFFTYWSIDGQTWHLARQSTLTNQPASDGSQRVAFNDSVYVGLSLTSHDTANIMSVVFDNISLVATGSQTPTPAAPTNLVATPISGNKVSLRWTDNANNETDFVVERNDGTGWVEATTPTVWATSTYGTRPGVNRTFIVDTPATPGTYQYRVKAARYDAMSAASNEVTVATVTALEAPASPWTVSNFTSDAGNDVSGYSPTTDTFEITGSTGDLWGNNDGAYFITKPVDGDFSITTQVAYQDPTSAWGKSGIDIREDSTSGSRHVALIVTPSNGLQFMWRDAVNGGTTGHATGEMGPERRYTAQFTQNFGAPIWLRLTKLGDQITGYFSNDGVNWTQYGRHTITMTSTVNAGIVHATNNSNGAVGMTTFSKTAISAPFTIAGSNEKFNYTDFSSTAGLTINGWSQASNGVLRMIDSGQNMRGSAFTTVARNVKKFTSSFDFQVPATAGADGFAFVIQGASPIYLAAAGGGMGYQGNSISNQSAMALKFDIYNNLDHTGVYVNNTMNDSLGSGTNYYGVSDMRLYGIDIDGGRRYHVDIAVDGNQFTWTIIDVLAPLAQFTNTVTLPSDLPTMMGSDYAYLGFTVGTGGSSFSPYLYNFSYEKGTIVDPATPFIVNGTAGADTLYVKLEGDTFNVYDNAAGTGTVIASKPLALTSEIQVVAADGNDTVIIDLGAFNKSVSVDGGAGTDFVQVNGSTVVTATNREGVLSGNSVTLVAGTPELGENVTGKVVTVNDGILASATADLSVAGLTINGTGTLDLKTFDVTVAGGNADTLAGYVKNGAIKSTATTNITTLGVIPQDGAVKVKYTYFGDVNGDGSVNLSDYFIIDSGYLNKRSGFANGDMNYDGEINLNDYFLIDSAYLNQKAPLAASAASSSPKAVFSTAKIAKKVKKAKPAKKAKKA